MCGRESKDGILFYKSEDVFKGHGNETARGKTGGVDPDFIGTTFPTCRDVLTSDWSKSIIRSLFLNDFSAFSLCIAADLDSCSS